LPGDNVIVVLVIVDCTKGQILPMISSMVVQ
jgi:translation initiation factor IF-1